MGIAAFGIARSQDSHDQGAKYIPRATRATDSRESQNRADQNMARAWSRPCRASTRENTGIKETVSIPSAIIFRARSKGRKAIKKASEARLAPKTKAIMASLTIPKTLETKVILLTEAAFLKKFTLSFSLTNRNFAYILSNLKYGLFY